MSRRSRWRFLQEDSRMSAVSLPQDAALQRSFPKASFVASGDVDMLFCNPSNLCSPTSFGAHPRKHREDGSLQGLLELVGVPYVSTPPAAHAGRRDKAVAGATPPPA